jgi:hypothetical protein
MFLVNPSFNGAPSPACVLATWSVAAGSSATDLFSLQLDDGADSHSLFRCGNFGMLLVCARNKVVDVSGTKFRHVDLHAVFRV